MQHQSANETGLIAWFIRNHVAANLLMLFLIGMGIFSGFTIRKQTTPDYALDTVEISVSYPGAAPQEVEQGVVVRIEEAIGDIEGIAKTSSVAREGLGTVSAQVSLDYDLDSVLNEVKARVDAIAALPEQAEKPVVGKQRQPTPVVFVAVHGEADEHLRKATAQRIRHELLRLPEITQIELLGDRDYEISIEVSEMTLREYGLTMSEVAQAVADSSIDLPGGTIRSSGGDILLRTQSQAYTGEEFARLVLRSFPDGSRLLLGDVATIRDGFVETEEFGRFDGRPTTTLRVLASGQQNELATAAAVRRFLDERTASLPDGLSMDLWIDRSFYLKDRLQLLNKNLLQGAILVFIVLSLFLHIQVAWWVMLGVPVTLLGALALMPLTPIPVTINTISLFGFILVLGVVVDDAIVIGESIYANSRARGHTPANVVAGARRVAMPATFGVLTTVAAFAPLLFVDGVFRPFFEALSMVVILCLFVSLMESKLILPAHLAAARLDKDLARASWSTGAAASARGFSHLLAGLHRTVDEVLQKIIHHFYRPLLERAIRHRGLTLALFCAMFIVTIGVIQSGLVRVVMVPEVPSDFIVVDLRMHTGASAQARDRAVSTIENALLDMNEEFVAAHPESPPMIEHVGVFSAGDMGALLFVEMPRDRRRPFEGVEISDMWRERVGDLPGVKELTFSGADSIGGGPPLSFRLSGEDYATLKRAAAELEQALGEFEGVHEVASSAIAAGDEIRLTIRPEAEALGLTQASLARQVRQAFYGEEVQRVQRGNDEVRVVVRYPQTERRSASDLENMRIRTPGGDEIPFGTVAAVAFEESAASITRMHGIRTATVSANVDPDTVEPGVVIDYLMQEFVPALLARYPGVTFALDGTSEEASRLVRNLTIAFVVALFLIYALIAIPLKSYTQPLVIMSVIPFGLIGAVIGHLAMGEALSMFSFFGVIALAGVVVNDSLIMLDFINGARACGLPVVRAVTQSGTERFRAIVLTSVTTIVGLLPITLETSVQAQFVIPMAISVSFGILFATTITLFLIPALYVLQVDVAERTREALNAQPAAGG
jgi:multidrug efflux pump subunit AcrB